MIASLIGGETSEQPGVLEAGLYILSSSIVGVVEKSKLPDGRTIQADDVVLAVPSNGLHTNGYSLVRALMAEHPNLIGEKLTNEHGVQETFLDAILKPHTCYYQPLKKLFETNRDGQLHGIAHITGGGIAGNLNRILPRVWMPLLTRVSCGFFRCSKNPTTRQRPRSRHAQNLQLRKYRHDHRLRNSPRAGNLPALGRSIDCKRMRLVRLS